MKTSNFGKFVKHLIEINELAKLEVNELEAGINNLNVENDTDKAAVGNMSIMAHSFRAIADCSESMLENEGIIKGSDGEFYHKVDETLLDFVDTEDEPHDQTPPPTDKTPDQEQGNVK